MSEFLLRDAQQARKKREGGFEDNRQVVTAWLVTIDYSDSAKVKDRPGYLWIREFQLSGAVSWALNGGVPDRPGMPVRVALSPKYPYQKEILSVDRTVLEWNDDLEEDDPYLPQHHVTHERQPFGALPGDPVDVYLDMLTPLRVYAASALTVGVVAYRYNVNGIDKYYPGHAAYDLSGHQPAVGSACCVLVYLNVSTNTLGAVAGATVADNMAINVMAYPPSTPVDAIVAGYVRLAGSATSLSQADINNEKHVYNVVAGPIAAPPGGGSGINTLPMCGA